MYDNYTIIRGISSKVLPEKENQFLKFKGLLQSAEKGDVFFINAQDEANVRQAASRIGKAISVRKQSDDRKVVIIK